MTSVLHADRVGIQASSRWLVRDVSFSLERGEVLAILGPNGAGKSTLLGALAGDISPAEGAVMLDGRPLVGIKPLELARRRAVLPQQTFVQFAFTAREIVEMGRSAIDADRIDKGAVDRVLIATEAYELQHRIFPTLSVGEQTRVSLSRVLAQETPILLLDEPTAALDLRHQQLVMEIARDLANRGAALVVVMHDLNLASAYADRILLLREGRMVMLGTPRETLTESVLSEIFGCRVGVIAHPETGLPLVLPMSGAPVLSRS
jgi:iron complex transport system ATP-binding protein